MPKLTREEIPLAVSRLVGGRPVLWAHPIFKYDGCDRTLRVLNADAKDQLDLLSAIERDRSRLEPVVGGPLVVIFHSVKQSAERYAEFVKLWRGGK